MNNKKRAVYIGLTVLILVAAAGAIWFYMGSADREPRLSVRQAVNIFAKEDIHLSKISDTEAAEINGVKPVSYFINDTGNKLHIYHYKSIGERKTAYEIWNKDGRATFFYQPENTAKNLLFIIEPIDEKEMTIENMAPVGKIGRIVFEKLNDTRKIVYKGAGANWESQTVVKYYEYFYKDENATLRYESWYKESSLLKYLGQDIESVGVISYEMQRPHGAGSGTGSALKPDGTVNIGSSGGNGTIPRADQEITFTIRWNDQEETFTARAK